MSVVLNGIYNFLYFINENWTLIAAIIISGVTIYQKWTAFSSKSKEEQIEIAKAQIQETMLKWVTAAEKDYLLWVSAGEIKRAEVIDQIFVMYPILSKVTNQKEIIQFIDDAIDEALKKMRKIFEENKVVNGE